MSTGLVIALIVIGLGAFLAIAAALGLPVLGGSQGGKAQLQNSMRNLVQSQRNATATQRTTTKNQASLFDVAANNATKVKARTGSKLTLEKKLRFAQWTLPPLAYYALVIGISLIAYLIISMRFNIILQALSLFSGPIVMGFLLNQALFKRFRDFDKDYPTFLMSLVGLLKTGLNPINALEAAADGLEDGSLCKAEVQMMLERLKLGISEDQSIGSFGEDILHEEIELFVQALLLSRRVGGNLSETLDRLARQVRKRQYFRQSAHAAVGQQRMSIVVILVVLVFILAYVFYMAPELVTVAIRHPIGWQVWQGGLLLIIGGIFWIRQVTKIRV